GEVEDQVDFLQVELAASGLEDLRRLGAYGLLQPLNCHATDVVVLESLENVVDRLSLDVRQFDLRLLDVKPGALNGALVAVEDRQGDCHAQGPGGRALGTIGSVVLERVGLVEDVDILNPVFLRETDLGLGSPDPKPISDQVGTILQGKLNELLLVGRTRGWN